jgi:CRISPR-associated protein Csb2
MLTVEVELLTGRYAATEHNDRSRAEWPPHPARFFSALVAALHDRDPVDDAERKALLWLEGQGAPQLDVDLSVKESVGRREVLSVFVPVNDVTLVGDPERELREVLGKLAGLELQEQSTEVVAEVKKLRRIVESERKKLANYMAAQHIAPGSASQEDLKRATGLLPERRNRQARTFPVIVPERTLFAFHWPDADPLNYLDALRRLCDRITRLGHSSSLVRCTIVERPVKPSLVPRENGDCALRVIGPGHLERLERAYKRHQGFEARVLPARPQRYGTPINVDLDSPQSVFADDWIVFERVGGARPLASRGIDLAVALRRTLIEIHGKEDLPAILSGQEMNGERSVQPHVAFVPLPWVGHECADGSVLGIAIILPRFIDFTDRDRLLGMIAKWETLRGDADDDYTVELGTPADSGRVISMRLKRRELLSKRTLDPARWCRPSYQFVTATPIALDRHPGNLRSNQERTAHRAATEAESSIADACERIGLPRPARVIISLAPLLPGAQPVRQFAPWPPQPGRARRARVHANIEFHERIRGPVLLGAGRYFGLGLCLPVAGSKASNEGRES